MISLLHIENIAVIESAELSFGSGFNVLTGETGAGKSIVVDAINAILGERTSRDLIRTGARAARVEAVFTGLPTLPWFEENGVSPDENGELLIQREIQPDGKNVCRAGGRILTVAQLRALGGQLINIHGQHDGQQLLDPTCHLSYLDRFGDTAAPREAFQAAYAALRALHAERSALNMDEAEKTRRLDTLHYQISELERAGLEPGEDEALSARRELLRNAGKLTESVEQAYYALAGSDDEAGAAALLADAEGALATAGRISPEAGAMAERLAQLRFAADELADEVRDLRASLDFSPGALDEVEGRLDQLYRLRKKYGATVEEMLDYLARCRAELDEIEFSGERAARLEQALTAADEAARKTGAALTAARQKAAEALQKRIEQELSQLDMPRVRFQAHMAPKAGEAGMDATGMDEVQFLMSANAGEELRPIHKIASGGELSRIMLALKNVLAENDDVGTLVFDEVDAGVSGRAAQRVAEKMADVAARKQVLCVTHLPQIAAMADFHFAVEKEERKGRTFTAVDLLEEDGRRNELARLTAGEQISAAALENAGELLRAAAAYKKRMH